jgi:hypothetical protein
MAVALGLACCGVAFADDDVALRVVEACRARLDARSDIGIERIQARCPELLPALEGAPWRDLVPRTLRDRREEISAQSLGALVDLVRGASVAVPSGETSAREISTQPLPGVLEELGARGQQGATRWERFKRWLKDLRERKEEKEDEEGMLEKWSRQLSTSEGIARVITWIGYGLLGALVLLVVVAELRAAGLFGARRRAAERRRPEAEWRRRLMLADVAAAPLAERPGMLLKLLGEALTRAHRLPAADGLTAGAIARRAQLDAETDRDELAGVAVTSERIRYAGQVPPESALEATVERAKALLARFARMSGGRR